MLSAALPIRRRYAQPGSYNCTARVVPCNLGFAVDIKRMFWIMVAGNASKLFFISKRFENIKKKMNFDQPNRP